MQRTAIGIAVIGFLIGAPALAADMAVKAPPSLQPVPPSNWAGFYIGGSVGGAWGTDHTTVAVMSDPNILTTANPYTLNALGVFGGGQLGYNVQRGNVVFGVEADFGYMALNTSASNSTVIVTVPTTQFQTTMSGGAYGDITGRLGYAFGSLLLYAKGGYALFDGEAATTFPEPSGPHFFWITSARGFSGWTAGAGAEYRLSPAWSLKAEYLHFDFGTEASVTALNPACCAYEHQLAVDTVKVGVNYHLFPGRELPGSGNTADAFASGGWSDGRIPLWTGFYIGAHAGGAWGADRTTVTTVAIPGIAVATNPYTLDPSGVFGGGQFGYNVQRGNVIVGVETDFGYMDLNASAANSTVAVTPPLGQTVFQTAVSGGAYGDITGRLGYAFGRALLYGKAGYALFDGEASVQPPPAAAPASFIWAPSARGFSGWTAGGGVEYRLSPAWSLKAEYLHFDFGDETSVTAINPACCSFDHRLTVDTVKVGANYHLGADGLSLR